MPKNIIIGCSIFEYDELPEEVRERLINSIIKTVHECYRSDHIEDQFRAKLENIGFMEPEFYWTGFGNQNDGACFNAKIDLEKICKHFGIEFDPIDGWECYIQETNPISTHQRSFEISGNMSDEIVNKIERLRLELSDEFFTALEEDYNNEFQIEGLLKELRSCKYVMSNELESTLAEASNCECVNII